VWGLDIVGSFPRAVGGYRFLYVTTDCLLMSFHVHYGATGHHTVEPRERCIFFMVYGAEAVLPPEVTIGSLRVKTNDEAAQDQLRREDIDLVDERRELQVDDLVLRRILNREGMNKLSPSWEGPFRVTRICRPGCVRLATEDGEPVPCPWNIEHLRKFYT
jgi:hypothetical protein